MRDKYTHMLTSSELRSLADTLDAVKERGSLPRVVSIKTWPEMRSAFATTGSRWSDRTGLLWLDPASGTWRDDQANCYPALCEECKRPITTTELAAYEGEAGYEAGWPAVCDDCAESR